MAYSIGKDKELLHLQHFPQGNDSLVEKMSHTNGNISNERRQSKYKVSGISSTGENCLLCNSFFHCVGQVSHFCILSW